MMFKNSVKLFMANFSLFWKVLLYKLMVCGICVLLMLPFLSEWGQCLSQVGFESTLISFTTNTVFINGSELLTNLFTLVQTFVLAISEMISANLVGFIYTLVVVGIVFPFLLNMSAVPAGECAYSYMASLNKTGFAATFISKFKKATNYSICRTIICVPFIALFFVGLYFLISLTQFGGLLQMFIPLIIVVYCLVILTFFLTTLSGWMPATIVFNGSVAKSMKKGLKAVSRRYWRVFSSLFITLFITLILLTMLTFMSVIIVLPLVYTWIVLFNMIMFFESQGMRYYVDLDTIITPRKLETCDQMKKIKDII